MMKKLTIAFILIFSIVFSSLPAKAAVQKGNRLWQDESVYSIMIDRFNDGDTKNDINTDTKNPLAFNGGDFQGIIDKLDYIHDMGFTAIRLTPIFENAPNGYHGYWVNDFYKTDKHFGTIKTFKKLVNEAHKRKMKVLIDFVTNNVSANNSWVNDSTKQDWFHKKQAGSIDSNNQKELENAWADNLPDLNQDNPEVSKYLIDAGKWWIKTTNIDGYTLPEVNMVPLSFWKEFSKEVKQQKKSFFLAGLPAAGGSVDSKVYTNAGIDSVFDFSYSQKLRGAFATTGQSLSNLDSDKNSFLRPNFFDNENTVRFTKDIVDKRQFPGSRWQTALVYSYTTPGIPFVYYGSEIALNGGEVPDNRRQMSFRAEKDLIDYITKLAKLRNQLPSLTRGTLEMLYEKDGMAVYKRSYKGETSVIAINNTMKSQHVTLTDKQLEGGKELRDLLEGDVVRSDQNKYDIIIDRDKSEIFVLTNKSGINLTMIGSLAAVWLLIILFLIKLKKRK
jgi:glycosidase